MRCLGINLHGVISPQFPHYHRTEIRQIRNKHWKLTPMEDLDGDVGSSVDRGLTRKTLIIVSHAHAPPLSPAPTLKFDLRRVQNPPKHIRDAYDGRSKRLRNHMLQEDGFASLLNTAEAEIRAELSNMSGGGFCEFNARSRLKWRADTVIRSRMSRY